MKMIDPNIVWEIDLEKILWCIDRDKIWTIQYLQMEHLKGGGRIRTTGGYEAVFGE